MSHLRCVGDFKAQQISADFQCDLLSEVPALKRRTGRVGSFASDHLEIRAETRMYIPSSNVSYEVSLFRRGCLTALACFSAILLKSEDGDLGF